MGILDLDLASLPHDLQVALADIPVLARPELAAWLREAVSLGGDRDEIVEVMVRAQYPPLLAAILVAMASRGLYVGTEIEPRAVPRSVPRDFTPETTHHATRHTIALSDGRVARILSSMGQPEIILYDTLLDAEECAAIMAGAEPRLERSYVGGDQNGRVDDVRTSYGMFYRRREIPAVAAIEQRLAEITGFAEDQWEDMQVLRYMGDQEYQPHFDFFEPATPQAVQNLDAQGGNRIGTFLIYLNEPETGGATYFPYLDLAIHPRRGQVVWFAYPHVDGMPDYRTEHAGLPVHSGVKWLATKWVRPRAFANTGPLVRPAQPASTPMSPQAARILDQVPRWQDIQRRRRKSHSLRNNDSSPMV